jgi:hypothetical protein
MRRRLRRALETLLHLEDTPHRIALAFGLGLWVAFCPLLGIHTLMSLGIAFVFRLSRAAILLGTFVNNPWTLAPMYLAGTVVGCFLLGVPAEPLAAIDFDRRGADFYRELAVSLRPYLWPFVVGNTLTGLAAGLVGYLALRSLLERRRLRKTPAATTDGAW